VLRVDDQKRTIQLPSSLANFRPASASFADGALVISFEPAEVAASA
jgi:hypothetical protein